jgi:hypothetical protein
MKAASVNPVVIPVEAYPIIQKATSDAIIQWELTFALVGLVLGLLIAYLYFRIWYSENGIGELIEQRDLSQEEEPA